MLLISNVGFMQFQPNFFFVKFVGMILVKDYMTLDSFISTDNF